MPGVTEPYFSRGQTPSEKASRCSAGWQPAVPPIGNRPPEELEFLACFGTTQSSGLLKGQTNHGRAASQSLLLSHLPRHAPPRQFVLIRAIRVSPFHHRGYCGSAFQAAGANRSATEVRGKPFQPPGGSHQQILAPGRSLRKGRSICVRIG